jgi:8-oxo-dGTP pyrophosphatase MutT (NUDIX family)
LLNKEVAVTCTVTYRQVAASGLAASEFFTSPNRWRIVVDEHLPQGAAGVDWKCVSRFGSVESAVVLRPDGTLSFDRPLYREAPNVNCVVWGKDADGVARFAVIRQPRPHADDPEAPDPMKDHDPVIFGQIPMGFLEAIFGKGSAPRFENMRDAAVREAREEVGASVVLNVERPDCPWHNPNPTFVATWSDLHFVEVDIEALESVGRDRDELIYSVEFITFAELRKRIAEGKDEQGAVYRMCTANSAWFIFFCCHPELFTP